MKKFIIAAILFSLPFTVGAEIDQYKAEAKQITGAFFEELKGELGKGLKAGGPVAAIGICNTRAPALAMEHSQRSGWNVARTSLKLRNPDNAPDAWETKVLQQFEEQRARGEGPDALVYTEVVEEGDGKYFRFMKGIVMPPLEKMPCLMCHGEEIDPSTAAAIDQLYPQDQARGYKAGQVRGAFTLKKKL
ncbi:MAG: DUF3365 domain-containing protein [Sedimenticolaceae bacterium]